MIILFEGNNMPMKYEELVNKEAYLKELQAILNADKWWSMTDDHRYYMKMSKIRQEIVKLKLELNKESK